MYLGVLSFNASLPFLNIDLSIYLFTLYRYIKTVSIKDDEMIIRDGYVCIEWSIVDNRALFAYNLLHLSYSISWVFFV